MNLEFRIFSKIEKAYGVRSDLSEDRMDWEFGGGYVNLEFAIKNPQHYLLEQWTGEVDSSGSKIFDGDIIRHNQSRGPNCRLKEDTVWTPVENNLHVRWSNYSDGEYVDEVKCWMLGSYHSLSEAMYCTKHKYQEWINTYNVIGNINENSELLQ